MQPAAADAEQRHALTRGALFLEAIMPACRQPLSEDICLRSPPLLLTRHFSHPRSLPRSLASFSLSLSSHRSRKAIRGAFCASCMYGFLIRLAAEVRATCGSAECATVRVAGSGRHGEPKIEIRDPNEDRKVRCATPCAALRLRAFTRTAQVE